LLAPKEPISSWEQEEFWGELTKQVGSLIEPDEHNIEVNGMAAVSVKAYDTGGLADFTGPAWLDGTPSKPEYILNAAQTERFFSLIDILENHDSDKKGSKNGGDNYFDISINVEKIEDDYDVEQMADKIRRMIYDDAAYRNVNSINHIR
jgi:hypothetical protein